MMKVLALASYRFHNGQCRVRSNIDAPDQLQLSPDVIPTIVAMPGKTEKSLILRKLLLDHADYQLGLHHRLYLWVEPGSALSESPIILIDSELHVRAMRNHLQPTPPTGQQSHEPGEVTSSIPVTSEEDA